MGHYVAIGLYGLPRISQSLATCIFYQACLCTLQLGFTTIVTGVTNCHQGPFIDPDLEVILQ